MKVMFSAFALLALVALVAPSVALSHSNGRGSMSNLQPEPTWIGMGGDDIQDMRFEEPIKTAPSDVAPLSAADLKDSCLFAPESVCIGGSMNGGTSYITAVTKPKGLVTRFFFDDETGIGSSGLFDQVIPSPEAGPGFLSGASAHFTGGKSGGRIKHIPEYSSESISYDFWLFVNDDSIVGFKSILYVGDEKHVAPGLMYHPDHNKFRITVDVVGHRRVEKESRATIPLRRWTHVSLSLSQRVVSLAVNGIVDTEFLLPGPFAMNSGDIFLASNPSAGNGLDCFIDNLQIHSPAASPESIADIGSAAYPGIPQGFVEFGCQNCDAKKARQICLEKERQLCSPEQLAAGGYQIGQSLGWVDPVSRTTLHSRSGATEILGDALCCRK